MKPASLGQVVHYQEAGGIGCKAAIVTHIWESGAVACAVFGTSGLAFVQKAEFTGHDKGGGGTCHDLNAE